MHKLTSKKLIALVLSFIVLIIIIILTYLLYSQRLNPNKLPKETGEFTNNTNKTVAKFKRHFNNEQVAESLKILNNESLSKTERYEAAKNLAFYFSTAYSASHDPELRKDSESIQKYAKENFSDLYEEDLFIVPCADPSCGEKPDEKMKTIQKVIANSGIDELSLDVIDKNLNTSIYIPKDREDEKILGFGLVIDQLEYENNIQASQAAKLLREYVKDKYKHEYTTSKEIDSLAGE